MSRRPVLSLIALLTFVFVLGYVPIRAQQTPPITPTPTEPPAQDCQVILDSSMIPGGAAAGFSAPQISADGKQLLFYNASGIYIVNMDGTGLHQVVQPPPPIASTPIYPTPSSAIIYSAFSFSQVAWSPDNKYIAYFSIATLPITGDLGGRPVLIQLNRINTDGSDVQVLAGPAGSAQWTISELIGTAPDSLIWSPDSQRIAYTMYDLAPNAPHPLYLLTVDGTSRIALANNAFHAVWSPQGDRIAYVGGERGGGITIIDLKGNVLAKLATNFVQVLSMSWSPDGKQIAFSGYIESEQTEVIYVANADGSDSRRIANGISFTWSPDGIQLAFSSNSDTQQTEKIFIEDVDGSNIRYLTTGGHMAWSPNETYVAFTDASLDYREGDVKLYVINADGSDRHLLSHFFGGTPPWVTNGSGILFESQNRLLSVGVTGFCPSVG